MGRLADRAVNQRHWQKCVSDAVFAAIAPTMDPPLAERARKLHVIIRYANKHGPKEPPYNLGPVIEEREGGPHEC